MEAKLQKAAFPGVTSSHHLHAMAALAVTMAEFEIYGKKYAGQVIKNAKALGSALHEMGIDVMCPHLGFTESHTLAVNVAKYGGGAQAALDLEKANIIVNKNMLPGDTSAVKPSGIRLGTQELTRLGMEKGEMEEVARLIYRVVVKKEKPEKVKKDVKELNDAVGAEVERTRRVPCVEREGRRRQRDERLDLCAVEADPAFGSLDPGPRGRQAIEGGIAQDLEADLLEDAQAGPVDGLDLHPVEDLHRPEGVAQATPGGLAEALRLAAPPPPAALGRHVGQGEIRSAFAFTRRARDRMDAA